MDQEQQTPEETAPKQASMLTGLKDKVGSIRLPGGLKQKYDALGKKEKLLAKAAGVVVFLFILLGLMSAFGVKKNNEPNQQATTPVATPKGTAGPVHFRPSRYAEDEQINEFEQRINILKEELRNTKLEEDNLQPPSVDFDITF